MQKFAVLRAVNRLGLARVGKWALAAAACLFINVSQAQNDSFATPTVLDNTALSGSVIDDNSLATGETDEPSHAGFLPTASLWYQWTATQDGEVSLDTIGTGLDSFGNRIDTVVAVYTGSTLDTLSQVAANDDMFPSAQLNIIRGDQFVSNFGFFGNGRGAWVDTFVTEPFNGPSHLRFNAKAGQTYYFAVDAKNAFPLFGQGVGSIQLNWAYHSSGVFRFASEDQLVSEHFDTNTFFLTTAYTPLYQAAETESIIPSQPAGRSPTFATYYEYNNPGVLVTVTRVAGSSGRVSVDYATEDGIALDALPSGDIGAVDGVDYAGVVGTLVFDDFEMSKTILIPISRSFSTQQQANRDFGIILSNPQYDLNEDSSSVAAPRVDPDFSTAIVRILDTDTDPREGLTVTNTIGGTKYVFTNTVVTNFDIATSSLRTTIITNVIGISTNSLFNFYTYTYYDNTFTNGFGNVTIQNVLGTTANATNFFFTFNVFNVTNLYNSVTNRRSITNVISFGTNAISGPGITNVYSYTNYFNGIFGVFTVTNVTAARSNLFSNVSGITNTWNGVTNVISLTNIVNIVTNFSGGPYDVYTYTNLYFGVTGITGITNFVDSTTVITTNTIGGTKVVQAKIPTNGVFNFEKSHYRIPEDVNTYWGGSVAVYVVRTGTNRSAATIHYEINSTHLDDAGGDNNGNNLFPLQPGSDYATPNPASTGGHTGTNTDFVLARGTLTFPSGTSFNATHQAINFTIPNDAISEFNEDFHIQIYGTDSNGDPVPVGEVNDTTVTILADDQDPPAGSVDQYYNADYGLDMVPPVNTTPPQQAHPGTDGQVYGVAIQSDDKAVIAGSFFSYNGTGRNNIARVLTNGYLDTTFNPGSGANDFINSVAVDSSGKIVIGGAFSSYNGTQRNSIARLNSNGTLDTTFVPGLGADGEVMSLVQRGDGTVVIGGKFTHINGQPRNYLAVLNGDGTLNTNFNPGTTINGPVYSVAVRGSSTITVGGNGIGGQAEQTNIIYVGATSGTITLNYDMAAVPDDIKVFYGGTNVLANQGYLLYDSGQVSGQATVIIPFCPTNNGSLSFKYITFVMNQGNGNFGTVWDYNASIETAGNTQIYIGGDFTAVGGSGRTRVARMLADGTLDTTFNPGTGADGIVYAMAVQSSDQLVVGGAFDHMNGVTVNGITRLNTDGGIDTTNFFSGAGADDIVYDLTLRNDDSIYVGGSFKSINGTHRLGFARLYGDGSVDTTFLDTAYNHFAGLPQIYFSDPPGTVFASAEQSDGNVIIGGSFNEVGGGQAAKRIRNDLEDYYGVAESFGDPNLWVSQSQTDIEPKTRDGVRNRSNVARLVGGATPGPGNVGLQYDSYSATKSGSFIYVTLIRTNGYLGDATANFSVLPGLAQNGLHSDYVYNANEPTYPSAWSFTRMHSLGMLGQNTIPTDLFGTLYYGVTSEQVIVSVLNNTNSSGDVNAQFQLSNPVGMDQFYLGGQNIPLGVALARPLAPMTIVDDTKQSGVFSFASTNFIANTTNAIISVMRSNGTYGVVSMKYSSANGTATNNLDYVGVTNQTLVFNAGVKSNGFLVNIKGTALIYTNTTEKTFNLKLSNLIPPIGSSASLDRSNTIVRILNPNFQGYVTLSATNYSAPQSAGYVTFTVNRIVGNKGLASVQYYTTNDSALNGRDYVGATNTVQWNDGDVTPKIIAVPLINTGLVGTNRQFKISLFNPRINGVGTNLLYQMLTNATLVIVNDNNYGSLEFSRASYNVNENGGYATISVLRRSGTTGTVSVNYATSNGPAIGGVNFSNTTGVLTFVPGQVSASFNVPIIDDGSMDPTPPTNFYFYVNLSNPTNATLGPLASATVNVLDAESYNVPPGSGDTTFDPSLDMNDVVLALAQQTNGNILAGGNFTQVSGIPKNHIARLNVDGSLDTGFLNGYSGANGAVRAIVSQNNDRIVIGGAFSAVDGVFRSSIARLMTDGSLDTSFNPGSGADSTIYALAETYLAGVHKIYAGGTFTTFNGSPSAGIVRLNDNGTFDSSFNVGIGANATVYAVAVYPTNSFYAGKLIVGGAFNNFNGQSLNGLVRLNSDGSVDTNFIVNLGTGANSAIHALAIQDDNRVLVGGAFTTFNGTALSRIARLNADGTIDTNFTAHVGLGANDTVNGITVQPDNRIILVGEFTQANGVVRNRITRLLPDGGVDPTINFGTGANGDIDAVLLQPTDGTILIGGGFTSFNDVPHNRLARLYGGSMTGTGAFRFTAADYQVAENGLLATVSILRTGGTSGTNADLSGNITVRFATSNGTAVAGIDYSNVSSNIVFPAGEVLKTVTIPIIDDFNIGPDVTVNLSLTNAVLGDQPIAVLTIINDDSAINFSSAFYSRAKNAVDGMATIDILRQGSVSGSSTVEFLTTTNGTAIPGTDYTPTDVIVSFGPGESDKTVQVPIINNNLPEGNMTVDLALTNVTGSFLVAPSNAVLTIIDTVVAPGSLKFIATNYVVNEGDGTAIVTVMRTNGSSGVVSASYGTTSGSALPGVNYTTASGTLTFGDGETIKTINVPLIDNGVVQGPTFFSVSLSNPTGGADFLDPSNTVVTVLDNDVGISFASTNTAASETDGNVPVYVLRLNGTNGVTTVDYTTTNGTAIAGVNYTATSGTLTFTNGESLKAIIVPLYHYPNATGDLNFGVKLSNPSVGVQMIAPTNTTVVIHDAEAGISFTNATFSVAKNASTAVITVVCANPSVEPVIIDSNTIPLSVQYATFNGTAQSNVDYIAVGGTLVFTNGVATNTFTVPIINNTIVTGDKTFTVKLFNPTAPGQVVAPSNQVVTIIDSNSGLRFSNANYTVQKSGVFANISVQRTSFTNTVSSVNFLATNGTAIAGVNFFPTNGTLTFTNGETLKFFQVRIINNTTVQPNETVNLLLSNPVGGYLVAPYAATLTILEDGGSYIMPAGSALISETGAGAPNGIIDSNEVVQLMFGLRDAAGLTVSNLTATLLATNGVTPTNPPSQLQTYGTLTVGGHAVSRPFTFYTRGTNGQTITATLSLNDNGNFIGLASFPYVIGTWATVISSTNLITINDNAVASPYPSTLVVSNAGTYVIKAIVTLTNINHPSPKDINVLVVSPDQKDALIMSHAGGGNALNHVNLTFDDAATNSLPQFTQIVTGTNKPTAYPASPIFP